MPEDPIDPVYQYVERAYLRLQAGDILMRCMEEGSAKAIHHMVEGLVLAGPQSLTVLQEILAEASKRKGQIQDDLNQVLNETEINLQGYGVSLPAGRTPRSMVRLSALAFLKLMREQNISGEKEQYDCLQILKNSKELMKGMIANVKLLDEIERYLSDWLWGLAYQSTRRDNQVS